MSEWHKLYFSLKFISYKQIEMKPLKSLSRASYCSTLQMGTNLRNDIVSNKQTVHNQKYATFCYISSGYTLSIYTFFGFSSTQVEVKDGAKHSHAFSLKFTILDLPRAQAPKCSHQYF